MKFLSDHSYRISQAFLYFILISQNVYGYIYRDKSQFKANGYSGNFATSKTAADNILIFYLSKKIRLDFFM